MCTTPMTAPAAPTTLAERVIATLREIGVPGMLVSGEAPLQALVSLLEAAKAEAASQQTAETPNWLPPAVLAETAPVAQP